MLPAGIRPRIVSAGLVCGLFVSGCSRSTPGPAAVTFNKDIAPIVFANCAPCHRPGGVAPFSLLTFVEAAKHSGEMGEETLERRMPPWLPERSDFPIVGERRLRDDQVNAIQRWVKSGVPEGRPADLPVPPSWKDGWELGQPDQILTPAHPYVVAPTKEDVYRNLVLRTPLHAGVFVRAVEFRTGGAPIHHAVIRVDPTSASRRRDGEDGRPGFDGMSWNIQDPDGHFIGWAPGRGPIVAPAGMPWRLGRGADLVVELHVTPTDTPVTLQPSVALFLTTTPPTQTPVTVKMGSKLIDIPAGERSHVVADTYELPVQVDLLSLYPHAHYLGKEMRFTARLPDGTEKSLLHIKQWNFHWQQDYRYVTPIPLPRGTTLTMRYTFDNSEQNAENPRHPPVRVQAGPRSTDEMAEIGLQVLPASREDAERLLASFDRREKLANVAMGEARVREAPNVAEHRALLGGSYVEAGRFADAVPHLQAALRLDERSSSTHNYLGVALMAQGRLAEALVHFRRAVALAPRDEVMFFNLGNALGELSRPAEAVAAYRRALALNPEFADPHANLGVLLFSLGRVKEAVTHYERAAELRPDSAVIHNNLAGALGSVGRYGDALPHVRRAIQLDPNYAPALDTLKRLQQLMGIR